MIFRAITTAATLLLCITIPFVGIACAAGIALSAVLLLLLPSDARNRILVDLPIPAQMAIGLAGLLSQLVGIACIQWVTWQTGRGSAALVDALMHGPNLPGLAWAAIALAELAGVQVGHTACLGLLRLVRWWNAR